MFQHGLSQAEMTELLAEAKLIVDTHARVNLGGSIYAFATNV